MKKNVLFIFLFIASISSAQNNLPKPTKAQLAWHNMEFYLFMHFGPNTFTDLEWGNGNEKEEIFNPVKLDCNQWCRVAKAAGAKGIIITAKHHDGFCLWPSKFSKHTVRESKWKNGKGDVLKELSAACKKYGLKLGVYISPWDRNHPDYGTEKYNEVFVGIMKELFTNYGHIWELWWDGANGEGPNGKKQVYDWGRFKKTVRQLSPNTVIFSDVGPDIRWCGNENGIAGTTNWNTLNTDGFEPGLFAPTTDTLNTGNVHGKYWIPSECDVSIRPGWFYHKAEDAKVKTPKELFQLYLKSVGRGANLLLNVPPDGRGLITEYDSAALVGFKKLRVENFNNNLAVRAKIFLTSKGVASNMPLLTDKKNVTYAIIKNVEEQSLHLKFNSTQKINCLIFKENIKNGQVVSNFYFRLRANKKLESVMQTTIGNKRIITFPAMDVDDILVNFLYSTRQIEITEIEAYLIDEMLMEK